MKKSLIVCSAMVALITAMLFFSMIGAASAQSNVNANGTQPSGDVITNAYGCAFSNAASDETTIKVPALFTDGSETDTYLGVVYTSYHDAWDRYPSCGELQFNLDRGTPLDQLSAWLQANLPGETGILDLTATPEGIPSPQIEFIDQGTVINVTGGRRTFSFPYQDRILFSGKTAPDVLLRLYIASTVPIEVDMRSNERGNWAFALPGPLEVGEHTIRISVLSNDGMALSQSEEVPFTVTSVVAQPVKKLKTVSFSTTSWTLMVVGAVIIGTVTVIAARKSMVGKK